MAKKTKSNDRLGSGLAAIFGDDVNTVLDEIQNGAKSDEYGSKAVLNVHDIRSNPYQPRKNFDETALNELAQSIKENGVFTPILVRKSIGGYELIAGERRLKASKIAGKDNIPAIILDFDDKQMMEISLLENIQREDLNIIEEAEGYNKLIQNLNYTQEQLADRLGKSRAYVTNVLRLLKLPQDVLKLVEENKLTMGHVRPLITLPEEKIREIATKAVKEGLSVRQVEQLATDKKEPNKPTKKESNPFIKDAQKNLTAKFSTKVKITDNSINISYHNTDELNRILEILGVVE